MSRTGRHPFREEVAPFWFLMGCFGFLGLVAIGISSENRAVDLLSGFGSILVLLAPFLVGALLSPGRKAESRKERFRSQRASQIFVASAVVSLVLAVVAFMSEAYEALGAVGFAALCFAWAAATNARQARGS